MDDFEDDPDYCDMNHSGPDSKHEFELVRVVGDPANSASNDQVAVCKYCGVEA